MHFCLRLNNNTRNAEEHWQHVFGNQLENMGEKEHLRIREVIWELSVIKTMKYNKTTTEARIF